MRMHCRLSPFLFHLHMSVVMSLSEHWQLLHVPVRVCIYVCVYMYVCLHVWVAGGRRAFLAMRWLRLRLSPPTVQSAAGSRVSGPHPCENTRPLASTNRFLYMCVCPGVWRSGRRMWEGEPGRDIHPTLPRSSPSTVDQPRLSVYRGSIHTDLTLNERSQSI